MKILIVAEQRDSRFKKAALESATAARTLADTLGAELIGLVAGSGVTPIAGELGAGGVRTVIAVDQPDLARHSNTALAKVIASVATQEKADIIILSATLTGKDLAPRVAAKLNAGLAADCVALTVENGEVIATRPVYAGKALVDVAVTTPVKIFTLRPNVFPAPSSGEKAQVEQRRVPMESSDFGAVVTATRVASGRPDVAEADVIVSGGRGMKGPEHFALIEQLAEVLGAAVGASRAVVDAGWRPHTEQVGQTGKTVSPTLYIACGISGAVQHLAGMSSSRYIVAINKDKDAPIFQVADYGIAGDVFEILPELTRQLKQMLGK